MFDQTIGNKTYRSTLCFGQLNPDCGSENRQAIHQIYGDPFFTANQILAKLLQDLETSSV